MADFGKWLPYADVNEKTRLCLAEDVTVPNKFCFALIGISSLVANNSANAQLPPPETYIDPVDQQIAKSGEGIPGRPSPCMIETMEQGYPVGMSLPTDKCVRMLPAEEWHGLWFNDFEGSQFCAAPAVTCNYGSQQDRVWLTSGPMRGELGGLYEVRFVGRMTMFKGSYGHMGASDYEIIVDRPISIKLVQAPPPPMSDAEIDAEHERCEQAGTCISWEKLKEMHPDLDIPRHSKNR